MRNLGSGGRGWQWPLAIQFLALTVIPKGVAMNILTEFEFNLEECLSIVRRKLKFEDNTEWENAKHAFVEFKFYEKAAGCQLPLLRQEYLTELPPLPP
jgi:hypothetical protein